MIIRWPGERGAGPEGIGQYARPVSHLCEIAGSSPPFVGRSFPQVHRGKVRSGGTIFYGVSFAFQSQPITPAHGPGRPLQVDLQPARRASEPGLCLYHGQEVLQCPEDELLAVASKEVKEAYQLMKKPPRYEWHDLRPILRIQKFGGRPRYAKTRDRLIGNSSWQEQTGMPEDPAVARRLFGLIMDAGAAKQSLGLLVHGEGNEMIALPIEPILFLSAVLGRRWCVLFVAVDDLGRPWVAMATRPQSPRTWISSPERAFFSAGLLSIGRLQPVPPLVDDRPSSGLDPGMGLGTHFRKAVSRCGHSSSVVQANGYHTRSIGKILHGSGSPSKDPVS